MLTSFKATIVFSKLLLKKVNSLDILLLITEWSPKPKRAKSELDSPWVYTLRS